MSVEFLDFERDAPEPRAASTAPRSSAGRGRAAGSTPPRSTRRPPRPAQAPAWPGESVGESRRPRPPPGAAGARSPPARWRPAARSARQAAVTDHARSPLWTERTPAAAASRSCGCRSTTPSGRPRPSAAASTTSSSPPSPAGPATTTATGATTSTSCAWPCRCRPRVKGGATGNAFTPTRTLVPTSEPTREARFDGDPRAPGGHEDRAGPAAACSRSPA